MVEAFGAWLSDAPLWMVAIAILLAMGIASFGGHRLRLESESRARSDEKNATKAEGQEGYVVSGVLSLLALLMGFTYGLAVDRFEMRRALVLEEANAIGTTYLRTQLLEEPHRARVSSMLVSFTDNRIALAMAPSGQTGALLKINDQLITDMWRATVAAFPSIRGVDFSSSYIESMNNLIDMDSARKAARLAKVPAEVFIVLFIYVVVAAGVLGYVLCGFHGRAAATFLFLLFLMSLILVIDIDRPTGGAIRESQSAMIMLRASMRAQPPAVFDLPAP